ncbi:mitochondrial ornithine transporter 1-like [Ptychodera flava]|uniref:mitochondrial ornithine transporter 1-like n=1 Tax=Ptychodera flava TaxID=63121 RepID=UPI00396A8EC8
MTTEEHVQLHPGGLHVVDGHIHHHEPNLPTSDVHVAWQTFSEFTAGAAGGVACVLAGQPFDTVKVKMQTYPEFYPSSWNCFKTTFKDEKLRGLYKGTVPALAANIAENSLLFMSYGLCKTLVCKLSGHSSADDLSSLENAMAGSAAAFFSSLGLCPTELVKCRMQAMHEVLQSQGQMDTGRVSALRITKTILREDGIQGLFKGLTSTWAREMPGYFFFFGGYELSRRLLTPKGKSRDDLNVPRVIFCGGLAGAFFWSSVYPIDVVKSRIQVQSMLGKVEGFMPTLLKIYRTEGMRALYSGLGPCVLRSFPSNGALLLAFEWTRKELLKL